MANEENRENKEIKAHDLFFHTDLSQQQIADILKVNRKTVYYWIKRGSWLRAKYTAAHAPMILAEQYYAQLAALNCKIASREDPFPTKEESEIIRKISITLRHITKRGNTACETMETFSPFLQKLRKTDPELCRKIAPHMDKYVDQMIEEGSTFESNMQTREEKAFEEEYAEWLASQASPDVMESEVEPQNGACNGALPETENPTEPLSTATSVENINTELSTLEKEKQGIGHEELPIKTGAQEPQNPSAKQMLFNPVDEQKVTNVFEYDRWGKFLEDKYKISQDPHVTRKNGITIIRRPSPLWGLNRSLFF